MLTWSLDRKQNARTSHIFMSPPNCTNISLYFKVMNCSILVKQDLPRSLKPIFSLRTSDWIQVRLVLGAWRCNLLWLLYVVFVFGVYLYMIYVRFQIYIYIYIYLCVCTSGTLCLLERENGGTIFYSMVLDLCIKNCSKLERLTRKGKALGVGVVTSSFFSNWILNLFSFSFFNFTDLWS